MMLLATAALASLGIDAGQLGAVTSSLTLLEVLVIPFRFANAILIE